MNGRYDAEVIVVGGGPAGASTAWHLARAGVDVLVLDRARFPREKACAECLSPEASRLLLSMGALDALEAEGARLSGMIVRAPDGATIRGDFSAAHGWQAPRDYGLAVRRPVLDTALLACARAAGARVHEGAHVSDVVRDERGGRGACVDTGSGAGDAAVGTRELRARWVVGADGLRSIVARRLGAARTRPWPRRLALVAHWRGVRDVGALCEMHVERDGFIGIADVGGGHDEHVHGRAVARGRRSVERRSRRRTSTAGSPGGRSSPSASPAPSASDRCARRAVRVDVAPRLGAGRRARRRRRRLLRPVHRRGHLRRAARRRAARPVPAEACRAARPRRAIVRCAGYDAARRRTFRRQVGRRADHRRASSRRRG